MIGAEGVRPALGERLWDGAVVGAGLAGAVVALEPALRMIAQRVSQTGTSQAGTAQAGVVRGVAERLPFRDGSFDAAMAIMTLHH